MKPFLYAFFHNETNDRSEKGMVRIPSDETLWPKSWREIEYKERSLRATRLLDHIDGKVKEIASKRVSVRGSVKNKVDIESLAYILECGTGLRSEHGEKRFAPSGGSRYPIETYLLLFKPIGDLTPGIYHYQVRTHALELFRDKSFSAEEIKRFSPPYDDWLGDANGVICLSAVFNRSVQKYGSRAYRYILLEAGHIAQNMLLAGTERNVTLIPIGGFNEYVAEDMMGLGSSLEKVIYTLYIQ